MVKTSKKKPRRLRRIFDTNKDEKIKIELCLLLNTISLLNLDFY